MATERHVKTKFWTDDFVHALPEWPKLLFAYLLTNAHTNIAGIYELPLHTMASELNTRPEVVLAALYQLKDKVRYVGGFIIVRNFLRHQAWKNEKVKAGVLRILADEVPTTVLAAALEDGFYWMPHEYPMDRVSKKPRNAVAIGHTYDSAYLNLDFNNNISLSETGTSAQSFPQSFPHTTKKEVGGGAAQALNPPQPRIPSDETHGPPRTLRTRRVRDFLRELLT